MPRLHIEVTSELPVVVGNTIAGFIVCELNKPTKIKSIHLRFYGSEETETIGDRKEMTTGTNVLVDIEKVIIDKETTVPLGTSRFGFSINVSKHLPSSYSNFYGGIKYYLKAAVKRSYRLDTTVSQEVEIVAYIDLNTYLPALQIQADYSEDRVVSQCCGISRGRIILDVVIDKRLFLRGETISLELNIINLSGVRVKKVYSRIMKTITTYFQHPCTEEKICRDFITKSSKVEGAKGYSETTLTLNIDIPKDMFIPNFRYSQLFKITFHLQVIANLSGCNTDMILQFKIYIGHLPFSADITPRDSFIWNTSTSSFNKSENVSQSKIN